MTHDLPEPELPAAPAEQPNVLLHWVLFLALMTALIGGAALIF